MAKIPKCGRQSRPALWSTFGRRAHYKIVGLYFFTVTVREIFVPVLLATTWHLQISICNNSFGVQRVSENQKRIFAFPVTPVDADSLYFSSILLCFVERRQESRKTWDWSPRRLGVDGWLADRPEPRCRWIRSVWLINWILLRQIRLQSESRPHFHTLWLYHRLWTERVLNRNVNPRTVCVPPPKRPVLCPVGR